MNSETEALDDLILGRCVKRGRHQLDPEHLDLFQTRLPVCGFHPVRIGNIEIEVGTRVPAWLISGETLDFGTIFWEVFTPRSKRKLFASEVRNSKGDWEIQIGPASEQTVYANLALLERYDASRPIGMY